MAEYTYEDIIMDPEDPRLEGAIGKECYFGEYPTWLLDYARNNSSESLRILKRINNKSVCHFTDECEASWTLIIIKKEEPYAERAKKWIKENGLKKGDYVKVTRRAKDHEDGWDGHWTKDRDYFIGKVIPVSNICESTGVIVSYCCCDWAGYDFPYFVLEKVEPEPKYVPFKSPQEFISAYNKASKEVMSDTESMLLNSGMWLKWQDHYVGITYISKQGVNYGVEFLDWDELFDEYTFLDGSPVGKEANGEVIPHEKKLQDELSIGTRFHYEGKLVEVVEGDQCVDCVFAETDCSQKQCLSEERSDKKNIYFKEVKSERLQAED